MHVKLLTMMLAFGVVATPAVADKPDHAGKGKGKGKDKGADVAVVKEGERDRVVVFSDRDRETVRSYWIEAHGRDNCPPGLAKKNNGCLPPGIAKKRYVVGHALPATVVVTELPPVLARRIGPAPAGYQYVVVDGDLVKLAVGTRMVVDAISSLVR
ncbi:MAG: hypothetical protein DMF78_01285 [Acidobacteria bacterium]|nr:MAG: hypothetical protein DMF78_01285 [Acidobacteriota bacterium]